MKAFTVTYTQEAPSTVPGRLSGELLVSRRVSLGSPVANVSDTARRSGIRNHHAMKRIRITLSEINLNQADTEE